MEKAKKSWQEKLRERTEQAVKERVEERIEEEEERERIRKKLVERTKQAVEDWLKEKEKRKESEENKKKREAIFERKRKRMKRRAAITGYVATPQGRWDRYEKSKMGWRYLFVKQISIYIEQVAKLEMNELTKEDLLDQLAAAILRIIDGGDCAKMNAGMKRAGIPRMTITIDHEVIHGEEDRSLLDGYEQIMHKLREKWKAEKAEKAAAENRPEPRSQLKETLNRSRRK